MLANCGSGITVRHVMLLRVIELKRMILNLSLLCSFVTIE